MIHNIIINTILIFCCLSVFAYLILFFTFVFGWFSTKEEKNITPDNKLFLSIIICTRNEEKNIINCLNAISLQNFQNELFEIIIADDNSEDNTTDIVNEFSANHPELNIIILNSKNHDLFSGKKEALKFAVQKANGEHIICTDADCIMSENWLTSVKSQFIKTNSLLISSPVIYNNISGFLRSFQALEFLSLVAVGAASVKFGFPFLANGANIAFRKDTFIKNSSFTGNEHIPSGDDIFTLLSFNNKYSKEKITFLKKYSAIVKTQPQTTLKDYINQRVRWASKTSFSKTPAGFITGCTVFFICISWLLSLILPFYNSFYWYLPLSVYVIKSLPDFILLTGITSFVKQKKLLWWFVPAQLIYPFYFLIVFILSLNGKYSWKGRDYKI